MAKRAPSTIVLVVDAMEESSLMALQDALMKYANLAALGGARFTAADVGICAIQRESGSHHVRLQVLLRPTRLGLRSFHSAARRLRPSPVYCVPNAAQLAGALRSVVDLLAGPRGKGCDGHPEAGSVPRALVTGVSRRIVYVIAQAVEPGQPILRALQAAANAEVQSAGLT